LLAALTPLACAAAVLADGAAPRIEVDPSSVHRGEVVRVFGVAPGCDGVTLISDAFAHVEDFAGIPAISARADSRGRFSVRTRVPASRAVGRYPVDGRCGGGNLGVSAQLHVLAAVGYVRCSGSFSSQGDPGGGFYRDIRAKRLTCASARKITRAWVVKHADGSVNPTTKSIVSGYVCTGKAVNVPDSSGLLRVLCARNGGRMAVRFVGSP